MSLLSLNLIVLLFYKLNKNLISIILFFEIILIIFINYEKLIEYKKNFSIVMLTQIPKNRKLDYPITAIATQFRLNQFNELYKKLENNKQRSLYFGSNAPFLYFANNTYFLNNENETIEYSIERSKKSKKR